MIFLLRGKHFNIKNIENIDNKNRMFDIYLNYEPDPYNYEPDPYLFFATNKHITDNAVLSMSDKKFELVNCSIRVEEQLRQKSELVVHLFVQYERIYCVYDPISINLSE